MTGDAPERYRIEKQLGAGGMGVVYRATDVQLQRTVAIKVLDASVANDASGTAIVREARASSSLNHPSICTVYEVAELDGRPCIVMEHVTGTSLAAAIPPGGFPAELVIRYGIQLADALAHAHRHGVIHCDLKSANVMIAEEGRAKVLDFGLARRAREVQRDIVTEITAEASDGTIAGTLPYMSPGVLAGHPPQAADDLWSLGVLLYELATGELPFRGGTRFLLATSIQRDAPAPMPSGVPPALRTVIGRCLARDSGVRYRHAEEVRAALETLQAGGTGAAVEGTRGGVWRVTAVAALVLVAVALIAAAWSFRRGLSPQAASGSPSGDARIAIAVLPFTNRGNDPDVQYLTDGIAESVISSLARVPGKLTVTAWTAVQHYRGREVDAKTIGRELGARALLRGSIVRRDGALSVEVELVDATSQTRMWGDTYQVQPAGVLSVQQEIATQVSSALQLRLSGDEQQALRRHHPVDAEAYQLYLKGQHEWYRYSPDGYRKSLEYFQQAIRRDPRYALAHAGVARVLSAMAYEGLLPPSTYLEVKTAASTALSLDDSLGAAHDALAQVQFAYLWNWDAAEAAFRRALDLSPRDESLRRMYGIFLRTRRRWDEAIAEMKQALALNPVSAETTKALGATYFWAGRHDLAIEQYERALALDPTHAQTLDLLADAYAASGQYGHALEARRRYLTLEGAYEAADALGSDTSEAGYRKAMSALYRRYLARLEEAARNPREYISPMEFAFVYIGIGDTERAFAALEQAFSQRAPWLSSLAADPAFEPLRSDPRFARLLSRIGLPLRAS